MATISRTDWQPLDTAPRDREVLLWVHSAWIGRWTDENGGDWRTKGGVPLAPVRYWADITPPD